MDMNINISEFVTRIFNEPPQPPHSFQLDLGSNACNIMGSILITGAQIKYGKSLDELDEPEIKVMKEYLQSMGWDADYQLATMYKEVLDYHPDGKPFVNKVKINNWQITFKVAL